MRPTSEVRADLLANETALKHRCIEREETVHGFLLATLSSQHMMQLGRPGVGKTFTVKAARTMFSDVVWFEKLLTRNTLEDEVIGYLDADHYANTGKYSFRTEGMMSAAHLAFIDETFKATSGLLNAFLSITNEREVTMGPCVHKTPTISVFGASNEWAEDETTQALCDRFALNYWVDGIKEPANKRRFLRERAAALNGTAARYPALRPIELAELEACQKACQALPIDDQVIDILMDLQRSLEQVGVYTSDRRIEQCMRILQAEAWLAGDSDVGPEHCEVLRHCLWSDPGDRENVAAAVGAIDKGLIGQIRALVENALSEFYSLRQGFDGNAWASETDERAYLERCPAICASIQDAAERVKAIAKNAPDRVQKRAREYLNEFRGAFHQAREDSRKSLF